MKSRKAVTTWLIVGVILLLGPVWGKLAALIPIIVSFSPFCGADIPGSIRLLSLASYILVAGVAAFPVGLVLTILALIKLSRIAKSEKGNTVSGDGQRGIQS